MRCIEAQVYLSFVVMSRGDELTPLTVLTTGAHDSACMAIARIGM